jgi:hypothetical protein
VTHTYTLTDSPNHLFQLQIIEGTPGFRPELGVEGAIDGISHFVAGQGGKQLSRSSFEAQATCKGSEIIVNVPSPTQSPGVYIHARAFHSGLRVYLLFYSAEADTAKSRSEALSFLNSIEVKGGCSSAVPAAEAPSTDVAIGIIEGTKDPVSGWSLIKREADGFSVLMPGPVKHDTRQVQVQPIPLTLQQFISKSGTADFMINVAGPYPKGFFSLKTLYDVQIDQAVRKMQNDLATSKVELIFVKKLVVNGYPGREYRTVGATGKRVGRLQFYSTPRYLILAMAFDNAGEDAQEKFDRFFKSLKVDTSQPK